MEAEQVQLIASDPILTYFEYEHLPPKLQKISKEFHSMAWDVIIANIPRSPERTVALRKLLESKDAAVRASLE
jgi:hypothetical protein